MKKHKYLILELILLFVFLPCILLFNIHAAIKAATILAGVIYVIVLVVKNKLVTKKSLYLFPSKPYWKFVLLRFIVLVVFSITVMYFFNNEKLFMVVKKNPVFWLMLSAFYSLFSVYPQEFLYRSFFFVRYSKLFRNNSIIIANALLFSLAHIGFKNPLVLGLTLVGGFIFAITFVKTKSLLFTSVEHAIYGTWLFTVGAGEMLAFPIPS